MKTCIFLVTLGAMVSLSRADGPERADLIVDAKGSGQFRTIGEALNAIPAGSGSPVIILIRNGLYREKVFIRRSHLNLVGENRDSTRIVYAELREEWNRKNRGSDWGAGVVNIDTGVTDVTIANLTVLNNHGALYGTYRKHQFAIRGAGTKIRLLHCNVLSDGGDALSLWDRDDGMYYHADCNFEGWVDYVCPRGWCYITRSHFFGKNVPSASIWHDGSHDRSQKLVITDSFFDGVSGFPLGRNHLDAQFFLLNCRFSANMADRPFIRPASSPGPWKWGDRHYFFNCHRDGGDYRWFADNLETAEGSPRPAEVTARWTFGGRWDPEASMPEILPFAAFPSPKDGAREVPPGTVLLRWVSGRNAVCHLLRLGEPNKPAVTTATEKSLIEMTDLKPATRYTWSIDEVTDADTVWGEKWTFTTAGDRP
jgi:pectinesterase